MEIHGREIGFKRTVLATCEIAELSPKGDIKQFDKLLMSKEYAVTQKAAAGFIAALSKGYEMAKAFEDLDYKPRPLTFDEVMCLDNDAFNELFQEAITAWLGEKVTVEAEDEAEEVKVKGKGKNAEGDGE